MLHFIFAPHNCQFIILIFNQSTIHHFHNLYNSFSYHIQLPINIFAINIHMSLSISHLISYSIIIQHILNSYIYSFHITYLFHFMHSHLFFLFKRINIYIIILIITYNNALTPSKSKLP